MQYFLDISLLAVIVATVVVACRRGFVRSVFGMAKTVVSVILTYCFGSLAANWIMENLVTERVSTYVYERLISLFEEGTEKFDLTSVMNRLPSWLSSLLEKTNTDPGLFLEDMGDAAQANTEAVQAFADKLAAPIATVLSDLIGYAAVFLLSMLALTILSYLLGKLVELPGLKQIDRALGLVLGVGCAVVYAAIYTMLMFGLCSMLEGVWENFTFHEAFEKTWVFQKVYEYNIIRWFFGIG